MLKEKIHEIIYDIIATDIKAIAGSLKKENIVFAPLGTKGKD